MLVFVYGTLRWGQRAHSVIDLAGGQLMASNTKTVDPHFRMYDLGAFPCVVQVGPGGTHIHGEVYRVTGKGMQILDELEGYPWHYNRALIMTESNHYANMYVYEWEPNHLPFIESGDWVEWVT